MYPFARQLSALINVFRLNISPLLLIENITDFWLRGSSLKTFVIDEQ